VAEPTRTPAIEQLLAGAPPREIDAWAATAFDTKLHGAADAIASLVREWERLGVLEPERALRLEPMVDTLRLWDGRAGVESVPATWFVLMAGHAPAADGADYPLVQALERALARLRAEHGSHAVAWGELSRLQRPSTDPYRPFRDEEHSVPVAGMPAHAGAAHRFTALAAQGSGRRYGPNGHVWAAEIRPDGMHVRSIVRFGQSGDPNSPHYFDQAAHYAAGTLRFGPPLPDAARPAY
jgi:acyl-homoserine-lactone acylase